MKSYDDKQRSNKRSSVAANVSEQGYNQTQKIQHQDRRSVESSQFKLEDSISDSPKQVAQRRQLQGMFPSSAQLQSIPEEEELQMKAGSNVLQKIEPEEEELLQGKFEVSQRVEEEEELLQGRFETGQRVEIEDEELLQGKFDTGQRLEVEDEEFLQGKIESIQRQGDIEEEELLQGKFSGPASQQESASKANNTGLPDKLKAGIEGLSGYSMNDVKVHYNSAKPAQLKAHAFAQGTDIHLAPGQDRHLPHEVWHVVQQRQGRVKPTLTMQGKNINDDVALETEADVMGAKALQANHSQEPPKRDGPFLSIVQRVYAPASITAGQDVSLHEYVTGTKEHFWSARQGNQTTKVKSSRIETLHDYDRIEADSADQFNKPAGRFSAAKNYTKARSQAGNDGYIENGLFTASTRVGATNFYAVDTGAANFQFYDYANDATLGKVFPSAFKAEAVTILNHVLTAENTNNIEIDKKDELMEKIIHTASLGMSPIDPAMWGQAIGNIQGKIIPRINAQIGNIRAAGLITANHTLKKIEFTGADFHKNGQMPVFCKFDTDGVVHAPDPCTVVYKPGDLTVDTTLFNSANSLASALDTTGTQISTYTLIGGQDNRVGQNNENYTFMEFVKSDLPTNTADLTGVWASIGANAAMAYLVGLEDMHEENVLLLKNRIQVIDMEATTGLFNSFNAMLWNKAITAGLRPKLLDAARAGTLATGTTQGQCRNAARNAFTATLDKAQGGAFNVAYATHRNALAGSTSRLVPIPTADLYGGIILARGRADLNAWRHWLDNAGDYYVNQCVGQTGSTKAFILRVLKSAGTYNALVRGDVPYYTRDLGSSDIHDEEGNQIDETGCSKVGQAINTEMNARRAALQVSGAGHMDQTAAYTAFNAQVVPLLTALNTDINAAIP